MWKVGYTAAVKHINGGPGVSWTFALPSVHHRASISLSPYPPASLTQEVYANFIFKHVRY